MLTLSDYFKKFYQPALALVVLANVATVFAWSGAVDSRVTAVEDRQDRQGSVVQEIAKDEQDIINLKDSVNRIDSNVSWIVQKMIDDQRQK